MIQRHGHDRTIVACATPPGRGAVAILRVSGPRAADIVRSLGGRLPEPRHLTLQVYRHPANGERLDQGLTAWFPAPHSFTGEDCAEFQVHGGPATVEAMLQACLSCVDTRLAQPGEFTRRAVANGRMDLAQAEALADLNDAESEMQRRQALHLLNGVLGDRIRSWRAGLLRAGALLEAEMDFSDEGDVDSSAEQQALAEIRQVAGSIADVIQASQQTIRIRNGFVVALAGPPNAGKSTLMNALVQREVSIVSPYRGTTRDAVEARCSLLGHAVTLVDLAGLRETGDPLEKLGIERARARMGEADLVVWLSPCNEPAPPPPQLDCLVLHSKADLATCGLDDLPAFSARTGQNLSSIIGILADRLNLNADVTDGLVSRERQKSLLSAIHARLDHACSLTGFPELVAEDLRMALSRLGEVTDPVSNDEILDHLFSAFCIGK